MSPPLLSLSSSSSFFLYLSFPLSPLPSFLLLSLLSPRPPISTPSSLLGEGVGVRLVFAPDAKYLTITAALNSWVQHSIVSDIHCQTLNLPTTISSANTNEAEQQVLNTDTCS